MCVQAHLTAFTVKIQIYNSHDPAIFDMVCLQVEIKCSIRYEIGLTRKFNKEYIQTISYVHL